MGARRLRHHDTAAKVQLGQGLARFQGTQLEDGRIICNDDDDDGLDGLDELGLGCPS